jgi:phenylalanyl-tRNA synthetase beta chain
MLLTAQPLHAYDYDKVKSGVLGVRQSQKGEELKLLGGKTIKLEAGAVVITNGKNPIGLGGVMGGSDTEVDEGTKTIILESANFDLNVTRLTAMHYGLFTDAATRFTKNQSPLQTRAVIAKAAGDILKLAGGRVSGKLIDDNYFDSKKATVSTSADFINERLGLKLVSAEMKKLLENVEFNVQASGDSLRVEAPFWRTDIGIAEDIVEEVGRLYGYQHLPLKLPRRDLTPAEPEHMLNFKSRLRQILSSAGANEVLTYSFVDKKLLRAAGQDPTDAYHIRNALSPDLQYYRLSLTPSLLEKVHPNIKAGYNQFVLFEIGKGHIKGELDNEKLPKELERLSLIVASHKPKPGAAYFAAKKYSDYLLDELKIKDIAYEPLKPSVKHKTLEYYEPARAANLKLNGKIVGRVGEFKSSVSEVLKLPNFCAGFDLHLDELKLATGATEYQPLNRFPNLEQDLCLRSSVKISYAELSDFLKKQLASASLKHSYSYKLEPLDIFQRPQDKTHKQTTWRISLWHPRRTLTTAEVNQLLDKIAYKAMQQLNAERI